MAVSTVALDECRRRVERDEGVAPVRDVPQADLEAVHPDRQRGLVVRLFGVTVQLHRNSALA